MVHADDSRWSRAGEGSGRARMAPSPGSAEADGGLAGLAGLAGGGHEVPPDGGERLKAPQIAPLLGLEVRHTFQLFKEGKLPNRGKPRDVWCYRSDVEDELNRRRRQVRAAHPTHGSLRSHPAAAAAGGADPAWLLHLGLSPDAGAGAGRPPAGSTLPAEQLAAASLLDTPGMTAGALRAILVRAMVLLALGPGADPDQQARLTEEADALVGHWLAFPPGPGRALPLQEFARRLACKVKGLARLGLVGALGAG